MFYISLLDNMPRAKSNPRGVILLEQMQGYNKMNEPTQYSYDERKIMPCIYNRLFIYFKIYRSINLVK